MLISLLKYPVHFFRTLTSLQNYFTTSAGKTANTHLPSKGTLFLVFLSKLVHLLLRKHLCKVITNVRLENLWEKGIITKMPCGICNNLRRVKNFERLQTLCRCGKKAGHSDKIYFWDLLLKAQRDGQILQGDNRGRHLEKHLYFRSWKEAQCWTPVIQYYINFR